VDFLERIYLLSILLPTLFLSSDTVDEIACKFLNYRDLWNSQAL